MAPKRITLTIPEGILQSLERDRKDFSYFSIQEVIIDALRDKYKKSRANEEKRGRPPDIDEMKILTAKKIFSKNGKKIIF